MSFCELCWRDRVTEKWKKASFVLEVLRGVREGLEERVTILDATV